MVPGRFMVFRGSMWVFMVFHDSRLVFHGSRSVFILFLWFQVGFSFFTLKLYSGPGLAGRRPALA